MPESCADMGPRCGVVATDAGVDFLQNFPAFFQGDAVLEHADDAEFVKFFIDRGVRMRWACDAPGFLLVLVVLISQEVRKDVLGPGQNNCHDLVG